VSLFHFIKHTNQILNARHELYKYEVRNLNLCGFCYPLSKIESPIPQVFLCLLPFIALHASYLK